MLSPRNSQGGSHFITRLTIFVVAAVLLATPLFSQITARLEGTVKDPTGAVVTNAKVTALNVKTGTSNQATTNDQGAYVFPSVQPGVYTITVEAAGFSKAVTNKIEVNVAGVITQHFALKVGAQGDTVTVESNALTVQTTDSQISRAVTLKEIDTLPALGRTPLTLAVFQPGIQLNPGDVSFSRVNGQRGSSNNSRLDGMDINDSVVPRLGLGMTATNSDSVAEFRIITEGGKAEYGRSAGATVDLITRGGTNKFHGSAFDYLRNTVLNSNEYFNKQSGGQRPKFIQNLFGGSFGGPIMKDKAFAFGNYQGRRTKQETVRNRTVLTPAAKSGIFTWRDATNVVRTFNIATNDPRGLGIDPTMASIMAMLPDPNNTDVGDTFNTAGYRFLNPTDSLEDQFTIRGDYNLTQRHKLFIRWSWQRNSSIDSLNSADATFPGQVHGRQGGHRWGYSTGSDWTFSNTLVNEFRFGHQSAVANFLRDARPQGVAIISNLYTDPISSTYAQGRKSPVDSISDNVTKIWRDHAFRFGGLVNMIQQQGFNDAGIWYNVSLSTGNGNSVPTTVGPTTGAAANQVSASQRTTFNNLYNDVLGRMSSVAHTFYSNDLTSFIPAGTSRSRNHKINDMGFYFQDDWKLAPHITLNLGLRYELFLPPKEADGIQATVGGAELINGSNQITNLTVQKGDAWYNTDRNNFAPRVGFAWDVKGNGKTAVRGNYGIFFDRNVGSTVNLVDSNTPGFSQSGTAFPNPAANDVRIRDGVPVPATPGAPTLTLSPSGTRNTSIVIFNPNLRTGYVQQFSLNIQQEIMRNTVLEVGYVGARGVKLFMDQDFNQMRIDESFVGWFKELQAFQASGTAPSAGNKLVQMFVTPGAAITALGASNFSLGNLGIAANNLDQLNNSRYANVGLPQTYLRNYPQYNQMIVGTNSGRNNYDSLQVSLRRSAGVLRGALNYTYSKSIDNISVDGNGFTTAIDNYNTGLNRGAGDFDHRHSINGSLIYSLPFGKGDGFRIGRNAPGWLNAIIGDWELGSLLQLQDGSLYSVSSQRVTRHQTGTASTTFTRANFTGDRGSIGSVDRRSDGKVFYYTAADLAMFSIPLAGEYGNSGRNAFRGPGYFNIDSSLVKRFKIPGTEGQTVTFRAEAYNLLNRTNFNNPATNLTNAATFGQISSSTGGRIMQLALRYDF
jgi:hypothetical protein